MEGRKDPMERMLPWRSPFFEGNNWQGFLISWTGAGKYPASGTCRYYDLVLPKNARVFMTDMTGPTNYYKIGYYYCVTYYLFPREVGTSLDQSTRINQGRLSGQDI